MQPFRTYVLSDYFQEILRSVAKAIEKFTNDEIMGNDLSVLCENIYEEYRIEPVQIGDEDVSRRKVKEQRISKYFDRFHYFDGGRYVDVDGIVLKFHFPFIGSGVLFQCYGSTISLSPYPEIDICGQFLVLERQYDSRDVDQEGWQEDVRKSVEKDIEEIRSGLEFVNKDVANFNLHFKAQIMERLVARKKRAERFFKASKCFEIPVSRRDDEASIIPVKKRTSPIVHTYDNYSVVHSITESAYQEILSVIKHGGSTMERTPEAYASMGEEALRNVLLVALNGTFRGNANGETFRNKGKTDICIEVEDRSAFVAECKMWTGEKEVAEALAQLDSYLTWRDCKTALIYFVRRKDFIAVADKFLSCLRSLESVRDVQVIDKNEFKCFMHSMSTPGQRKEVRVLLFNLYWKEELTV